MELFLVTFSIMLLAVLGMAVGVLLGRLPIAGSCGGLNAVNGSSNCQSCSRPCASLGASRRKAQANRQEPTTQPLIKLESKDAADNQGQ